MDLWLPPKPAIILPGRSSGAGLAWIYPAAGRYRAAGGGGGGGTRTFAGQTGNTGNATSHTYTNHSISTAAADRYVVVVVMSIDNTLGGTHSGVTIGGNAATRHGSVQATSVAEANNFSCSIWGLTVTSGTTATIVASYSATMIAGAVAVYALYGLSSTTPHATAGNNTGVGAATSISTTINVPSGGIGIGGSGTSLQGEGHTASGLTEDADASVDSVLRAHAFSDQSMSSETGRTISSSSASSSGRTLSVATWA